jgi:outer membrane lipoprotein SlyB
MMRLSIVSHLALLSAVPIATAVAQGTATQTRICLAPANVEGNAATATSAMDAVRETFTSFLTGPSLAVAPLTARLQSQVREEAKVANCAYLLLTTVKHTRKSGNGLLNRMAGAAAQQAVYSAGSTAGAAVGGVAGSAVSSAAGAAASGFAGSVRNKDEVELSYRLESNGTVVIDKTEKKRADSDGEDLLTPVVRKASEAIADAVSKKKG